MEDQILGRIDLQRALAKLSERDRVMVLLVYELERPGDYTYTWPPRLVDIGKYVGTRFHGRELSESTIRYRQQALEDMWQGRRGPLRQNHLKIDLHKITIPENPVPQAINRRKEMTEAEFNALYKVYQVPIRKIARKLGGPDDDLVEDLQQEGLITLWNLDLSQVDSNQDAYIRQAVKFKMIDFIRRTKVGREESLDSRLLSGAGDQVTQDPTTGKISIIPRANPQQWTPPRGDRWGWVDDSEDA